MTRISNTLVKRLILSWEKITEIKTLALWTLTYFWVNLPDPPDDDDFLHGPDSLVIWFLWDGKQSTVGRTAVCQSYDDGGLGSVDVFPFLSSAKTCWLNRLMSEGSVSGDTEFKLFPDLHKLKSLFNEFVNLFNRKQMCNHFWKDITKHYKKLNTNFIPERVRDSVSECIHYYINDIVYKRIVDIKDCFNVGVIFVLHLMATDVSYHTFESLNRLFTK